MTRKRLDLIGDRYGRLVVIKELDKVKNSRMFLCKCDCGNEKVVRMNQLRTGKTKSCGCLRIDKIRQANSYDLTGKKFGRLSVISKIENKNKEVFWNCVCDCGNLTEVSTYNLRSGKIKSCGCLRVDKGKELKEYHEKNLRKDGVMIPSLKRKKYRNNRTGVKGVSLYGDKYRASISIKGKSIYLGTYNNINDAASSRKKAEEKYHKPFLDDGKKG